MPPRARSGGLGRAAAVFVAAVVAPLPLAQRAWAEPAAYAFYRVQPGDTLGAIARRFDVDPLAIAKSSGLYDPDRIRVGERLVVPLAAAADRSLVPRFFWPLRGRVTSGFGLRWGRSHEGLDIAAPRGAPIAAAAPGVVVFAGWRAGYGRTVVLQHSFGLTTLYAHASAILVRVGDAVAAGEPIARVGATGDATGPHLHFEVRVLGVPVDPAPLLTGGRPSSGRARGGPRQTVC
ncbi:MAG: LysM peptidoglycan-binding domain-containing M23 family metallopeptidase [Clostridia bacterium]|nr:LysM peptidoglycan-binding domain-containing M23 family metallopeptidase [Clostridia bacterium]